MELEGRDRISRWYERLTLFRAVRTIVLVAIVLVIVAGALERIVEPDTFTSLGLAYWWAITTVTTVGYGDIVPESSGGRVVGSLLMLTGLALIPTLTSVVVSLFVSKLAQRDREQDRRDYADHASALTRIEERLERLESRLPS